MLDVGDVPKKLPSFSHYLLLFLVGHVCNREVYSQYSSGEVSHDDTSSSSSKPCRSN